MNVLIDDVLARLEKLLQGPEAAAETTPGPDESEDSRELPVSEPTPPVAVAPPPSLPSEPSPPPVLKSAPAVDRSVISFRRFEFVSGMSQKFWEMSLSGNSFTVRFGRIGTAGQSQTKSFASDAKAKREAEGLIVEKLKKGYVEKFP